MRNVFQKILFVLLISFGVIGFLEFQGENEEVLLLNTSLPVSVHKDPNHERIYLDLFESYPELNNKREIVRTKVLGDFIGSTYNLVEFSPLGYSIYNDDYSVNLEISANMFSPYKGLNNNLIYLGAFNYFSYTNTFSRMMNIPDTLTHNTQEYSISLTNENREIAREYSKEIKENIEKDKHQSSNGRMALITPYVWVETTSIRNPHILLNAETNGFNGYGQGRCGYVAGALLIYYASRSWGWTYLYNQTFLRESLVDELQGNKNGSSTAPDLEDSLNKYMNSKGATHNAKVNMWHIPSAHTFFDRIKEDKPVVLYGRIYDPAPEPMYHNEIDHAVVVYKVTRTVLTYPLGINIYSNYRYTCHFGWFMDKHDDGFTYNEAIISHNSILVGGLVNLHK